MAFILSDEVVGPEFKSRVKHQSVTADQQYQTQQSMWWTPGKKEASPHHRHRQRAHNPQTPNLEHGNNHSRTFPRSAGRRRRGRKDNATEEHHPTTTGGDESMYVETETQSGDIEVSLPAAKNEAVDNSADSGRNVNHHIPLKTAASTTAAAAAQQQQQQQQQPSIATVKASRTAEADSWSELAPPFGSIAHLLSDRRKVHRAQFAVTNWSSSGSGNNARSDSENALRMQFDTFRPRPHRVPLFGHDMKNHYQDSSSSSSSSLLLQDAVQMLKNQDVSNEMQTLKNELAYLDAEITLLMEDRDEIEKRSLRLTSPAEGTDEIAATADKQLAPNSSFNSETHRLLLLSSSSNNNNNNNDLEPGQRKTLQKVRGNSWTISLKDNAARNAILDECLYNKSASWLQYSQRKDAPRTVGPDDCAEDGAATTVQHVCFWKTANQTSLFLSRDVGESFCHGTLPDSLVRRMKAAGLDPDDVHARNGLLYLSVGSGPNRDSYFAEFRSGECWWAVPDHDLDVICKTWSKISRVVFGPGTTVRDIHGRSYRAPSWVILSRDGRVAWKNVPARLHQLLEGRIASEAAPVEVSLGFGDSFFVRFLDGSVDYCLPAHMAESLEKVASPSLATAPTSVILHPDLPGNFILRHS